METATALWYMLDAVVGGGGMARVVEVHVERLDGRVAAKLVPVARTDPMRRGRFRREARSSAVVAHPNAVANCDAGEADGYLHVVVELVDDRSLAAGPSRTDRSTSTRR